MLLAAGPTLPLSTPIPTANPNVIYTGPNHLNKPRLEIFPGIPFRQTDTDPIYVTVVLGVSS